MGKSGGGNSTSTTTPTPPQIPSQLQPWLNAAVGNVTSTMPYAPLQLFAQPHQQQIPELSPQQLSLINEMMNVPYQQGLLAPGKQASNMVMNALGYGGGPFGAGGRGTSSVNDIGPTGPAPAPFTPPTGTQDSRNPVLPPWGPPPPQMGWTVDAQGNPVWGVVNPTPGFTPPPAPAPNTGASPSQGLPPGTHINPVTGTIEVDGSGPPVDVGGGSF